MSTDPGDEPGSAAAPEKTYRLITGNADALPAIDAVISRVQERLYVFDHDLKERGYNSPARYEVLRAFLFARRTNEIRMALHETNGIEGYCPRLMLLLQQFPTTLMIHRTVGVAREAHDPLLIADEAHFWHKLHYQHPRSVLTLDSPNDTRPLLDRFEQIWESTEPAVSASTSGL